MFDWVLNPFLHALYQRCQLVETGQKTEKIIIQLQLGGRVTRATFDLILYLPNRTKFLVNFQITHFCICSSQRHFQLQKCDILYSMRKSHNVIIRKIKLLINPPKLPYILSYQSHHSFLWIWSHLLKKFLMENIIFLCSVNQS